MLLQFHRNRSFESLKLPLNFVMHTGGQTAL
jgi:hypothetical protein